MGERFAAPTEHVPALSVAERERYLRQIRLPGVGLAGQQRLARSSVLIVGAGGLGSPVATYLAMAGVGRLGIADGDRVDPSNLHRQSLHRADSVGQQKAESARQTLLALNPMIQVDAITERLTSDNALELVSRYDIIVDGTDNFPTRYLLNDACVLTSRPLVYGSVDRFSGQASVFATTDGPCYRCVFPDPPEPGSVQNCADAGVLGVLPGLVGMLQAIEVSKLILGLGDSLAGRLLLVDALEMQFRTIVIARDPECPACGTREIDHLIDYDAFCNGMTDSDAVPVISPRSLHALLESANKPMLIDVREPYEWNIARIDGATLIPLRTFAAAASSLDRNADIVVYCHHGQRSEAAVRFLRDAGFTHARNLDRGIDGWSAEVDPRVPRY